jgi:hypothetical protein
MMATLSQHKHQFFGALCRADRDEGAGSDLTEALRRQSGELKAN